MLFHRIVFIVSSIVVAHCLLLFFLRHICIVHFSFYCFITLFIIPSIVSSQCISSYYFTKLFNIPKFYWFITLLISNPIVPSHCSFLLFQVGYHCHCWLLISTIDLLFHSIVYCSFYCFITLLICFFIVWSHCVFLLFQVGHNSSYFSPHHWCMFIPEEENTSKENSRKLR